MMPVFDYHCDQDRFSKPLYLNEFQVIYFFNETDNLAAESTKKLALNFKPSSW